MLLIYTVLSRFAKGLLGPLLLVRHKKVSLITAIGSTALLVACSTGLSEVNASLKTFALDDSWQTFTFSDTHVGGWRKLCVLGPYIGKEQQARVLGFDSTLIPTGDDSKMWLVFISEREVVGYVAHTRSQGDFLRAAGQCFLREDASFTKEAGPNDWVYLIHSKNA